MRDANVYEGVHVRHGYGIANDDSKTMTQQLDQVTANDSLQKKNMNTTRLSTSYCVEQTGNS